jgi:hypothetical protein
LIRGIGLLIVLHLIMSIGKKSRVPTPSQSLRRDQACERNRRRLRTADEAH